MSVTVVSLKQPEQNVAEPIKSDVGITSISQAFRIWDAWDREGISRCSIRAAVMNAKFLAENRSIASVVSSDDTGYIKTYDPKDESSEDRFYRIDRSTGRITLSTWEETKDLNWHERLWVTKEASWAIGKAHEDGRVIPLALYPLYAGNGQWLTVDTGLWYKDTGYVLGTREKQGEQQQKFVPQKIKKTRIPARHFKRYVFSQGDAKQDLDKIKVEDPDTSELLKAMVRDRTMVRDRKDRAVGRVLDFEKDKKGEINAAILRKAEKGIDA